MSRKTVLISKLLIYTTNSSFCCVEHEEFKKLLSALRAGNTPLNRKQVCGVLLDKIFEENIINCSNVLNGQTVCMTLDGWTNIVNKSVICMTVTTNTGEVVGCRF